MTSGSKADKHTADPKHWLEYAIFFFVVATAIATAAAACYTRNQWLTAQEQLAVMADTERRQLRAYVLPTARGQIDNFGTEKPVIATLEFKNSGQTPAYNLRIRMFLSAGTMPPSTNPLPNPQPEVRMVLGPGTAHLVVAKMVRVLTLDEIDDIKSGRAAVHVYGDIDYFDAFEKHRCAHFKFFMGGSAGKTIESGLTQYPDGNDEEC
jgi:hypothetical protein